MINILIILKIGIGNMLLEWKVIISNYRLMEYVGNYD